jgi:hypothetical protein
MLQNRSGLGGIVLLAAGIALSLQGTSQARMTEDEQALWELEHAKGFLGLWHKDFLGWPSVNAAPVHKDHITDWITAQTSEGLKFKTVEFRPAAIQVTGEVAATCYWITFQWTDKDGNGASRTLRVLHTLVREGKDWPIIGGMSMPEGTPKPLASVVVRVGK